MGTLRQLLSQTLSADRFGIITGTFLISQFPNVPGKLARLKSINGTFWFGSLDSLGTGRFPMPYSLGSGIDTGWFLLNPSSGGTNEGNLNKFYQNAASGSIYLAYWVQS